MTHYGTCVLGFDSVLAVTNMKRALAPTGPLVPYDHSGYNVTSILVLKPMLGPITNRDLASKHTTLVRKQYVNSGSVLSIVTTSKSMDDHLYSCAPSGRYVPPHTLPTPPLLRVPSLPMAAILSFPEEVLERILALCIDAQTDAFANPSWHTRQVSRRASSILLVNRTFLRIATPLLYNTVVIRSAYQLSTILDNVFRPHPELASFVKTVAISGGSYDGLDDFVRLCVNLEEFDMTLDNAPWEEDVREKFGESLMGMRKIKSLVVRKDAYLTQEKPKHLMGQLSNAIVSWTSLVSFPLLANTYAMELTPWHIRSA